MNSSVVKSGLYKILRKIKKVVNKAFSYAS